MQALTPISRTGSIYAILFLSLIRTRVFHQAYSEVNDLRDDAIKNHLCYLVGGSKPLSFDDALANVQPGVCLDISEPDARLRVLMLQANYLECCERLGLAFDEKATKAAIEHLVAVLQPQALKARVGDAVRIEKNDLKDYFFGSAGFTADEAKICEK